MDCSRTLVCSVIGLVAMVLLTTSCAARSDAEPAAKSASGVPESEAPRVERPAVEQLGGSYKIPYGERDDEQFGMLSLPAGQAPPAGYPVVVLVHGGFWSEPWDYTLMSPLADDLTRRGYAAWNIEFARVGGNGGYPGTFDDVGAAIDLLVELGRDHPLNLARAVVVGHSSGGHLALWAQGRSGSQVSLAGAVGLGAVVDLEAFPQARSLLGGTIAEHPERYVMAAPALDPDVVVLVHGDADVIVPLSTLAPAEAANVTISTIAGADHFSVIDPDHAAWEAAIGHIEDFVQ